MLNKETKAYKNKIEYINKYSKENYKQVIITISKRTEQDIIDELNKHPNSKSAYIKNLIRKDLKSRKVQYLRGMPCYMHICVCVYAYMCEK